MTGAQEVFGLAADLGSAAPKVAAALHTVFAEAGDAFAEDWASNARETSGTHGKHYPDSIDSETRLSIGILVETGPNSAKKQGRMGRGFELGGENQPAHLDGLRALPQAERRLLRGVDVIHGLLT